jgi:flagellar protein FlaG
MDIKNVNQSVSPPEAIQPTPAVNKDKTADELKRSKSIQLQSGEDRQGLNFTVGDIEDLSKELNSYMDDLHTSLGFFIHEELENQVVVEIRDRETDEVIRQIPPEELLKIREKMVELTGLLFDQTI